MARVSREAQERRVLPYSPTWRCKLLRKKLN